MKNFILNIVKVFILCVALNGYSQGGCGTKWFKTLLEEISKGNGKIKKNKDNPDALAAYEFFYRTGKVNDNLEVDDSIKFKEKNMKTFFNVRDVLVTKSKSNTKRCFKKRVKHKNYSIIWERQGLLRNLV